MSDTKHKAQGTFVTMFAIWNSMVGGGLVSHPWAFAESGVLLSIIINTCSLAACFYTCSLLVKCCKGDDDFSTTMLRFFGKKGYYAALITAMLMLYGGALIYYQLLTQTLFPVIIGVKGLITGQQIATVPTETTFSQFSLAWTSIIVFIPLYVIVCLRDRTIFIRMSTFGVLFILIQILFVVLIFFYSIFTTDYNYFWTDADVTKQDNNAIVMFGSNFQSLTGMLAAGYFLHQLGLPIILDNKNQKNNTRDVFLGYFMVYLTYCVIGICGYFGFSGSYFEGLPIKQNLLNMFGTDNPIATFIRVCSFFQIFSVYPLLFHVVRVQFFRTFFDEELHGKPFYIFNFIFSLPCLILAIWFPNVGSLLGYCGSYTGLFTIYLLPIWLHLKWTKLEVYNPILLKMLERKMIKSYDEVHKYSSHYESGKIKYMEAEAPDNKELTEQLIEIKDQPKYNEYKHLHIQAEDEDQAVEVDCNVTKDINHKDFTRQMEEIFEEYKLEVESNKRPSRFKLIRSVFFDLTALTYGIAILVVQFI